MTERGLLRDYGSSRAVLMGTWSYQHLDPLPAARHSLERMNRLITGELCGWPDERVSVLGDQDGSGQLSDRLITLFEDATDVALFYFVGHGQMAEGDQGTELCLGLVGSRLEAHRRSSTSLPFRAVRDALRHSPAATKIVILDCCYAGLATLHGNTLAGADLLNAATIAGAYTMAASDAHSTAWYETDTDRPQTYFTRALADTVEDGIPGEGEALRLRTLFIRVRARLAQDGRPVPVERNVNAARDFAFAYNATPAPLPPVGGALESAAAQLASTLLKNSPVGQVFESTVATLKDYSSAELTRVVEELTARARADDRYPQVAAAFLRCMDRAAPGRAEELLEVFHETSASLGPAVGLHLLSAGEAAWMTAMANRPGDGFVEAVGIAMRRFGRDHPEKLLQLISARVRERTGAVAVLAEDVSLLARDFPTLARLLLDKWLKATAPEEMAGTLPVIVRAVEISALDLVPLLTEVGAQLEPEALADLFDALREQEPQACDALAGAVVPRRSARDLARVYLRLRARGRQDEARGIFARMLPLKYSPGDLRDLARILGPDILDEAIDDAAKIKDSKANTVALVVELVRAGHKPTSTLLETAARYAAISTGQLAGFLALLRVGFPDCAAQLIEFFAGRGPALGGREPFRGRYPREQVQLLGQLADQLPRTDFDLLHRLLAESELPSTLVLLLRGWSMRDSLPNPDFPAFVTAVVDHHDSEMIVEVIESEELTDLKILGVAWDAVCTAVTRYRGAELADLMHTIYRKLTTRGAGRSRAQAELRTAQLAATVWDAYLKDLLRPDVLADFTLALKQRVKGDPSARRLPGLLRGAALISLDAAQGDTAQPRVCVLEKIGMLAAAYRIRDPVGLEADAQAVLLESLEGYRYIVMADVPPAFLALQQPQPGSDQPAFGPEDRRKIVLRTVAQWDPNYRDMALARLQRAVKLGKDLHIEVSVLS